MKGTAALAPSFGAFHVQSGITCELIFFLHSAAMLAVLPSVAAYHTNRPVRLILPRNIDMLWSGGRNPFLAKYQVGYDNDGRLLAMDMQLYLNAGTTFEERALLQCFCCLALRPVLSDDLCPSFYIFSLLSTLLPLR